MEFSAPDRSMGSGRLSARRNRGGGSVPLNPRWCTHRVGYALFDAGGMYMPRLRLDEPDALGSSLAAEYLGVHRSTLESWRRRGELKPTVVEDSPRGRLYRYSREDL